MIAGNATIAQTLTLAGTGTNPTLNGNGRGTVLTILTGANVTIENLGITGGSGNSDGQCGGIYIATTPPSTVILNNSSSVCRNLPDQIYDDFGVFTDNRAVYSC